MGKKTLTCADIIDLHDIPVCNNQVQLRLGGLTHRITFQLMKLMHTLVTITYECAAQKVKIKGKIQTVGTEFVEVRTRAGKTVTIMMNRICSVQKGKESF